MLYVYPNRIIKRHCFNSAPYMLKALKILQTAAVLHTIPAEMSMFRQVISSIKVQDEVMSSTFKCMYKIPKLPQVSFKIQIGLSEYGCLAQFVFIGESYFNHYLTFLF